MSGWAVAVVAVLFVGAAALVVARSLRASRRALSTPDDPTADAEPPLIPDKPTLAQAKINAAQRDMQLGDDVKTHYPEKWPVAARRPPNDAA